jgi:hypothetical protein
MRCYFINFIDPQISKSLKDTVLRNTSSFAILNHSFSHALKNSIKSFVCIVGSKTTKISSLYSKKTEFFQTDASHMRGLDEKTKTAQIILWEQRILICVNN